MKKRIMAILLAVCFAILASAQAEVDFAQLDDMSLEQLEALNTEVSARIKALKVGTSKSADIFSLESAGGIISYAVFVMNDKNFKISGSNNPVETVVVMFDYTNKEDDDKMLQSDFWIKAFQNGTEIDSPNSWSNTDTLPPEISNFNKSVLKGGTICVARAFVPADDSPITIMVNAQGSSSKGEKASMELDFRNTTEGKVELKATEEKPSEAEQPEAQDTAEAAKPAEEEEQAQATDSTESEVDPYQEFTDKETVKKVQQALNDAGYNCGTPDGVAGKNTKNTITNYQREHGLKETGTATAELLNALGLSDIVEAAIKANKYQAVLQDIRVSHNSIGVPTVYVSVKNIGDKNDIVAFTFATCCKNAYGEVLKAHNFGDTVKYWIWQEGAIKPGKATSVRENWFWTLNGFDTAYHIDVWLTEFRTSDGVNHTIAPEDFNILSWDAR